MHTSADTKLSSAGVWAEGVDESPRLVLLTMEDVMSAAAVVPAIATGVVGCACVETVAGCTLVVGSCVCVCTAVAPPLLPRLIADMDAGLAAAVTVPDIDVDAGTGSGVDVPDGDCGGGGDAGITREGVHIDQYSPVAWQV